MNSSGGAGSGGESSSQEKVVKVVTVKHPESNKLKPTAKKGKAIQVRLRKGPWGSPGQHPNHPESISSSSHSLPGRCRRH